MGEELPVAEQLLQSAEEDDANVLSTRVHLLHGGDAVRPGRRFSIPRQDLVEHVAHRSIDADPVDVQNPIIPDVDPEALLDPNGVVFPIFFGREPNQRGNRRASQKKSLKSEKMLRLLDKPSTPSFE